ncbi:2'-deoxynucleoside 5'-phosphate n-hydrolase 1 [Plakobranchus ocellatus]|uniref:2'-deoxynucleoside 5'-phosphate n-hydrolase 1 n=1 Tax=Plakobranchus ocellatus TaxID=259542 RepID=A0AAV4B7S0_9GAST|nr:2'-deoxynucleoside 5'-phosphate n-hydrolase 1 [Plakobranchus ocellatus]
MIFPDLSCVFSCIKYNLSSDLSHSGVVAEVTQPSLGVGYELGRAVAWNIPILCLFRPSEGKSLSCMIRGAHDDAAVTVVDYTQTAQVTNILDSFFKKVKK